MARRRHIKRTLNLPNDLRLEHLARFQVVVKGLEGVEGPVAECKPGLPESCHVAGIARADWYRALHKLFVKYLVGWPRVPGSSAAAGLGSEGRRAGGRSSPCR